MKKPNLLFQETNHNFGHNVYSIPVSGRYLIYSPLGRLAALVNRKALSGIVEICEDEARLAEKPELLQGLFHKLQETVIEIPAQRTGPIRPAFLGIIPTRTCNMSCVYCGFKTGCTHNERMELDMVTAAVDWMGQRMRRTGQKIMEIHFFGGEPFVEGEVVDVAVHRTRAIADKLGLVPRFEVATNGVFDDKRASFLGDYFDTVVLSFDGLQEIHDRHRPMGIDRGSFETVSCTANRLTQSAVKLCFRTCVTKDSVAQMENTARWFCETFRPSVIDFEPLQPTPESRTAGLEPPDPYDFAVHFTRACRIIENCGARAVYASSSTETPRLSFCPLGNDTLIVLPDGRLSGCYLPDGQWTAQGMDLSMGRLTDNGTMNIDIEAVKRLRRLVTEKPRCERCFCRWTCAGGCHVNHSYPGCSSEYNDFCIQTRIITTCSILRDLGFEHMVETLIEDRIAMEGLAMCPSDCIKDWKDRSN